MLQSHRGTWTSEGNYEMWRKDSEDAYDTMEWLSQQLKAREGKSSFWSMFGY